MFSNNLYYFCKTQIMIIFSTSCVMPLQPYPVDGICAAALCKKGTIHYNRKEFWHQLYKTENIILNIIHVYCAKMVRYMDGLCFGKFLIKKKVFLFWLACIKKIVKYYYNRLVTRSRLEDSEYLIVNILFSTWCPCRHK